MTHRRRRPGQNLTTPAPRESSIGSVHLDALRGAAALLVFLNHTRALYFASSLSHYEPHTTLMPSPAVPAMAPGLNEALAGTIKLASEAVVIFFVLSGYLVGGSVLRSVKAGRWSWGTYLNKRLTRLYMVLLPAIVLGLFIDHLGLHLARPGSVYYTPSGIELITTWHLREGLRPMVALGNALFLQGILVPDLGTNDSIWSLANEFWYYMIFPLIVLIWKRAQPLWIRVGQGLLTGSLIWFIGLRMALLFPVWIMGALLVLLPRKLTETQARMGSMAGLVLLLGAMGGVRLLMFRAIVADYVIAAAATLLLYFLMQQHAAARNSIYKTVAGFFSRISYSLYLFHLPLAVFLCGRLNNPWRPWKMTAVHLLQYFATDAFVVLCVYVLWRLFESNTEALRVRLFEAQR